jgi:hypothetical protein
MSVPDWRTSSKGTRVRVALWLLQEVGEGNSFTKADLRGAFPGVEQVDRRMRDLRPQGWEIHTNQQDPTLAPDELRLVHTGTPVWEVGRSDPSIPRGPGRSERQAVLRRDDYTCQVCGVGSAEAYPDDPTDRAVLLVVVAPAGGLLTACRRCRTDVDSLAATWAQHVASLTDRDRQLIAAELASGRPSAAGRLVRANLWNLDDEARRDLLASLSNG